MHYIKNTLPTMTPRQQIIKINNIEGIVDKINKFVLYYAKMRNQLPLIYSIKYQFLYPIDILQDNSYIYESTMAELYQIDYEQKFYYVNFDYIYNNSPFMHKQTMREVIDAFAKTYYAEYLQIEEFIKKMLYSHPTSLEEQDFNNLNKLYNKIKLDGVSNSKSMKEHFNI